MEPSVPFSDQLIREIIEALVESRPVLIWGLLGAFLGFIASVIFLFTAFKTMVRLNWPPLKPNSILRVRLITILIGVITLIPAFSWTGLVAGAGLGARVTIHKGDIIESATVSALSSIAPPLYAMLAAEPESILDQGVSLAKLRFGVEKVTEEVLSEIQVLVSQKIENSNVPGIAGYISKVIMNWLAHAKVKDIATYATDVFDHLEDQQIESPTSSQISAAIGTVHITPIATRYISRAVQLYSAFAMIPAIAIFTLPFIVVKFMVRRNSKNKIQPVGASGK